MRRMDSERLGISVDSPRVSQTIQSYAMQTCFMEKAEQGWGGSKSARFALVQILSSLPDRMILQYQQG